VGTELKPFKVSLPVASNEESEALSDVSTSSEFLGRLQLYAKGKAIDKGLISPGHWGLPISDDDVTDLGEEIVVLPLVAKPKALDFGDRQAIITRFDIHDPEFQRIRDASATKNSDCMFGPTFLVIEMSTNTLYELFCGNKTLRHAAKEMQAFLPSKSNPEPQPMRLGSMYKEFRGGAFSCHVPVVKPYSGDFKTTLDPEKITEEVEKFRNQKGSDFEVVPAEEETKGKGKRAR